MRKGKVHFAAAIIALAAAACPPAAYAQSYYASPDGMADLMSQSRDRAHGMIDSLQEHNWRQQERGFGRSYGQSFEDDGDDND